MDLTILGLHVLLFLSTFLRAGSALVLSDLVQHGDRAVFRSLADPMADFARDRVDDGIGHAFQLNRIPV